jgi:hypothetical protein
MLAAGSVHLRRDRGPRRAAFPLARTFSELGHEVAFATAPAFEARVRSALEGVGVRDKRLIEPDRF